MLRTPAEVAVVTSAFTLRARIADLEEEEKALQAADRRFWEHPEHTPEAQTDYSRRRERIQGIRRELHELERTFAIELIREAGR